MFDICRYTKLKSFVTVSFIRIKMLKVKLRLYAFHKYMGKNNGKYRQNYLMVVEKYEFLYGLKIWYCFHVYIET